MYKQMAVAVALSCVSATAVAGYGFEPASVLVPDAAWTRAITIGDVSGDGRDDLVVLGGGIDPVYRNKILVYVQAPDGTLAPPLAVSQGNTGGGGKVKLADLDDDGLQDILVSLESEFRLLRNEGGLVFTPSALQNFSGPLDFDFMDVDADGNLDIVCKFVFDDWVEIHFGDGQGAIRERRLVNTPGGEELHLVDMNGDGQRDLAFSSDSDQQVLFHLHDGAGFSTDYTRVPLWFAPYPGVGDVAIADFDSDGFSDIAVSFFNGTVALLRQGRHGFDTRRSVLQSPLSGRNLQALDIDDNGYQDLLQVLGEGEYVGLHLGRANGHAPQVRFRAGPMQHARGTAVGDLNDDGIKDLAIATSTGSVAYLRGRANVLEADLAVHLGLSSTDAVVRVDNLGEFQDSQSYGVTLSLDARFGVLTVDTLSAGCSRLVANGQDAAVTCTMDGLPPGANRTLTFPISVPPHATMNPVTASARITTELEEPRSDNNLARKRILVAPVGRASTVSRSTYRGD